MSANYISLKRHEYLLSQNLTVFLHNLFASIITDAGDHQLAGLAHGLYCVTAQYPPFLYPEAWKINSPGDASVALLIALISKCSCSCCNSMDFSHILSVISNIFTGICKFRLAKVDGKNSSVRRLLDAHIIDQCLVLTLRVLNLYYTIIMDHNDTAMHHPALSSSTRTSLSPLHKLSPIPGTSGKDQRLRSIAHLAGTSVKVCKPSAYFHSASLDNIFDSLRGAFSTYLINMGYEAEDRFCSLLITGLNALSSILEVMTFSQISVFMNEILLYCRTLVEFAPRELVGIVIQLFKVLFGDNTLMLTNKALRTFCEPDESPPKDLLDVFFLKSANAFTEFVVNSGHNEFHDIRRRRYLGWLCKDIYHKEASPAADVIAANMTAFEPFVSFAIQLYQSTNSAKIQSCFLDLMCELVRGGINFRVLDPESRLLNFIIGQLGDFETLSRLALGLLTQECLFIRSAFQFLCLLSQKVCAGEVIIEKSSVFDLVEGILLTAQTRPPLRRCVFDCLQILFLDLTRTGICFNSSILKLLNLTHVFQSQHPTEIMHMWELLLNCAFTLQEKQNLTDISHAFFENFLKLNSNWNIETVRSSIIALRLCSPCIYRPIDTFFERMMFFLQNENKSWYHRLLYGMPYFFVFLCTFEEDSVMPRIEFLCEFASVEISRLLVELLLGNLSDLCHLSLLQSIASGAEYEQLLVLYLHILSYSVRSKNLKCISDQFRSKLTFCPEEFGGICVHHPFLFIHVIGFYSSMGFFDQSLLEAIPNRFIRHLSSLLWYRTVFSDPFVTHCLVKNSNLTEISNELHFWSTSLYLWSFGEENHESLIAECIASVQNSRSQLDLLMSVLELVVTNHRLCGSDTMKFIQEQLDLSFILPTKFLNAILQKMECAGLNEFSVLNDEKAEKSEDRKTGEDLTMIILDQSMRSLIDAVNNSPCDATSRANCDHLIVEFLVSLIRREGTLINAEYFSRILTNFDSNHVMRILSAAYDCNRHDLISFCMDEINNIQVTAMNCGELYNEYSIVNTQRTKSIATVCVTLAYRPFANPMLQLFAQTKISQKSCTLLYEEAANWASNNELFTYWMTTYISLLDIHCKNYHPLDDEQIDAITFSISQPSFISAIEDQQNSREIIEQQLQLVRNLVGLLGAAISKRESARWQEIDAEIRRKFRWKATIRDRSNRKNIENGFIADVAKEALKAIFVVQATFRNKILSSYLFKPLENLAKAVTRLPLLNDISCISLLALGCGWHVELEIHRRTIAVPTVNVHYLSNVDVLKEFVWRISWSGWNRCSNFDNFSMSLFGVLSSTPTGSELSGSSLITEQIMASTVAIEGLTTLLLANLLYPIRGNPVMSKFIAKGREIQSDFLQTSYGQRLCMLKAMLTDDFDPDTIYRRNLEFIDYNGCSYRYGMMSVHALWNMTGLLDEEKNLYTDMSNNVGSSPKKCIHPSNSSYLIEAGRDSSIQSCLRMLFDTYSHWFRAGIDALPLPLLSAVIKSMTVLTDLFTDLDQYKFVFGHIKILFNVRSPIENLDFGNIIYLLLKCTAILGMEYIAQSKIDGQKLIFAWIDCGLRSELSQTRIRTLHGVLFIIQAVNGEDIKMSLTFLHQFIITELELQIPGIDSANMNADIELFEYSSLLWTIGFSFCCDLLFSTDEFRTTFLYFVSESLTSLFTSTTLMDLLTSGIEQLIVCSHIYVVSFDRIAFQMLENYFTSRNKFVYALRIIMACLYRGMQEGTIERVGLDPHDSRLHLMEQHSTIFKILSEGAANDSDRLLKILPYVLNDSLNQSEVINSILKELIHRYPNACHPRPAHIFLIIHHWFCVLHSRETDSIVNHWILNGLQSFKYVKDPAKFQFFVSAFLSACSIDPTISTLFHVIICRSNDTESFCKYWFNATLNSFLHKLDQDSREKLKVSLEVHIDRDGTEKCDARRIENFPLNL